ncbi:MAG TPA: FtsK/SpoIIIE domain-containing protein [Egibacteraceae bacterium]|nr:FtsK/SpoIIIE domain-containing protein [Egibacteraceae bacterium]
MLVDLLTAAPWVISGGGALYIGSRFGVGPRLVLAGIRRDRELARSCFQAARIRRRWPRVAQHLGLVLVDRTAVTAAAGNAPAPKPRYVVPRMRVTPDSYGVVCTARTVAGVGLPEWQKAARHLADDWRATRVAVTQVKPGKVRIRAVRVDPLAFPTSYAPDPTTLTAPKTLDALPVGLDEYGEPVDLRLSNVAGICICGLPGYGKTSFINNLLVRLAPHPAVQFVGFDGKSDDPTQGDYGDMLDRFTLLVGDDLEQANKVLAELVEFRRARAASIRTLLGRKNAWHGQFTPDWPLVLVLVDEAHTYFAQVKDGGDKALKARNALAAQNAQYVEDLIKKGRSVGILTVLATQKGTGDAIPTQIRDVCSVSLAFACRTIEAAVAALGEDIRQYPEANPVQLRDPVYVGVATMAVEGRPGFTRVRMPYVPDETAAAVAQHHRDLVATRGQLPAASLLSIGAPDAD